MPILLFQFHYEIRILTLFHPYINLQTYGRQLLYPAELLARMERVTGIEPASPAWKAGALAVVLHPQAH